MSLSLPKRSSASDRRTEMPLRRLATITGVLWIATVVTSIPAVLLYDPPLNNEDLILGAGGGDTRIFVGATLELLPVIANIGTAVVPFAVFRRYDERLALGYVTARLVECGFIAVRIVSARRRPRRDLPARSRLRRGRRQRPHPGPPHVHLRAGATTDDDVRALGGLPGHLSDLKGFKTSAPLLNESRDAGADAGPAIAAP